MDSITQAALGSAIGVAILRKRIGRISAAIGAIVATIPDLDIVLLPFCTDIQRLVIHRGYSHSILFSFVGAFLLSFVLSRVKWTKEVPRIQLLVFSWLVLSTHLMLDVCTTYGTQLFLPFSNMRVGFDTINVVDPIYTLPLLIGLVLSLKSKKVQLQIFFNRAGLFISTLYLLGTIGVKQYVNQEFERSLFDQGVPYKEILTVPVSFGSMNWYGVAKSAHNVHIGKYSFIEQNEIDFHHYSINDHLLDGLDSNLVHKLKWFSKGFYTVVEYHGMIRLYPLQVDMRGYWDTEEYEAPTVGFFEI